MSETIIQKRGKHIFLRDKKLHTTFMSWRFKIPEDELPDGRITQDTIMKFILKECAENQKNKARVEELESRLRVETPEMR